MRDELTGQVRYLVDEIDALQPLIRSVPDQILSTQPTPGSLSLKELYFDLLQHSIEGAGRLGCDASAVARGIGANSEIQQILTALREARMQLVACLEQSADEAWQEGGESRETAEKIVESDLNIQQSIAERLSERPIGDA
jgi:hypothetical protein